MQSGPVPRFVVHTLPFKPSEEDPKRNIRRFVSQVGNIENARRALEFLEMLEGSDQDQQRKAA